MKTDGLSINLATVRQQFGLKDGVEACLKHGITAISPWRDHVQATGIDEAARIIKSQRHEGHRLLPRRAVSGRRTRPGGRPRSTTTRRMIDEARGDRRRLPHHDRRRTAERLARHQGGARACSPTAWRRSCRMRAPAKVPLAIEPLHPMYAADRGCISLLSEALDLCDALGEGRRRRDRRLSSVVGPGPRATDRARRRAHPRASHLRLAGADEGHRCSTAA